MARIPVVEFIKASRVYGDPRTPQSQVTALKPTTFAIYPGEFVAIIGPSGSGKSTLLHLLGLLDRPNSGRVLIDGVDTSRMSDTQLAHLRNQKIGFVFQQFNLLRRTSALRNVELPLVYSQATKTQRWQRSKQVLESVGLGDRLGFRPSQLSGGQQQRVAIARALVTNPKLLLADEPTGNLDSKSGKEIIELFKKLHREGSTIILVTHDLDIAKNAKRRIVVKDGQVSK